MGIVLGSIALAGAAIAGLVKVGGFQGLFSAAQGSSGGVSTKSPLMGKNSYASGGGSYGASGASNSQWN